MRWITVAGGSADDLEAFAHLAHQLFLARGNAHAQVPEVHRRLAALGKELLFFLADVMVDVLAEDLDLGVVERRIGLHAKRSMGASPK